MGRIVKAQSKRQRRKEWRRLQAECREMRRRWLGACDLYLAAERANDDLRRELESERKAKYAEMLVIPDANVPRGTIRLVTRVR
jgi:hypothetical protein